MKVINSKLTNQIKEDLIKAGNKDRAVILARFFKTGKGEYSEGDKFLGIKIPTLRKIIQPYIKTITLAEILELLKSEWHDVRLAACILLVKLRQTAVKTNNVRLEKEIYKEYLANTKNINNWDLVDISAREIVGMHLLQEQDKDILNKLATSSLLWERRIAVISTWAFIKVKNPDYTFNICKILINDKHDLIHKACGWMLRELGKSCGITVLDSFLDKFAVKMPRTMLRYAIEKHPEANRQKYLKMR